MPGMVVDISVETAMMPLPSSRAFSTNARDGDVVAQVVTGIAGGVQHQLDDVLADVVDVALDDADDDRASGLPASRLQVRPQHVDGGIHRVGAEQDLGDEIDPLLVLVADISMPLESPWVMAS